MIEVDMHGSFDEVAWEVQPEGASAFDGIPTIVAEVVFFAAREAVRNAARHGRQKGTGTRLCLSIGLKYQNGLVITIEDSSEGFAIDQQILFSERRFPQMIQEDGDPGTSDLTSNQATSTGGDGGHGLALHSTMMAVIGGHLIVESTPGHSTRVTLELPKSAWQ